MPAFINVKYEIPKKNNDEDQERYLLKVIYDVKSCLIKLKPGEEPNLYETLEIINAVCYISHHYPIDCKMDLSKVKSLIKNYEEIYHKRIEDMLENSGQLIFSK